MFFPILTFLLFFLTCKVLIHTRFVSSSKSLDRLGSRPTGSKSSDPVSHLLVTGMDYLRNPRLFKGMGFSLDERQALGKSFFITYFVTNNSSLESYLKRGKQNLAGKVNKQRIFTKKSKYRVHLDSKIFWQLIEQANFRVYYYGK